MTTIDNFTGQWKFLSNFYEVDIEIGGIIYPTSEHAYQAMKSSSPIVRQKIANLPTPGQAKRMGQEIQLVPGWHQSRVNVMRSILIKKFENPTLRALLLATGDRRLVEGNTWGDTFWGECPIGTGDNNLGKLLMEIREDIRFGSMMDSFVAPKIYVASKTKHAELWKYLRKSGFNIISTWIDEAGISETLDWQDLWSRCIKEASTCDALLVYCEDGDVLKGAWVEVGCAMSNQIPVHGIGCESFSISRHSGFHNHFSIEDALDAINHKDQDSH